jgi:DNA-binding transcriptional LysR family regulator
MFTPLPTTSLKSLTCFRSIINAGSATAAASELGLTQPGVSRLLALLEKQIGFQLFERSKGRLIPTREALLLYKEVDIALQSIERVQQLARNLHDADFGELKIVAPPSFAEFFLSQVISGFIEQHPNVQISLDSHSAESAKEMVALRAVDCGFVKMPADHPALDCVPLVRASTICVMPPNHRLAPRKTIRVADLDGEPLIMLAKGRPTRLQIDDAFRDAGVRMNIRIETHTVGSACALAGEGTGIALVNEMLAGRYAGTDLALRRFEPDIFHEYAFMRPSEAPMTRVMQKFFEHSKRFFEAQQESYPL